MTAYTFDENIVSDLFKDAYGYRPRESWWKSWNQLTNAEKQKKWDDICNDLEIELNREKTNQENAFAALKKRIDETISLGAKDVKTAIKWIIESEQFDDFDLQYGADYFCYHFNLNYNVKSCLPIQEVINEMLAMVE